MSEFKARWREIPNEPLYPFGHGIGYTTFAYGVPQLSTAQLGWDDTLTITTVLTNTGRVAARKWCSCTSMIAWPAACVRCVN